MTPSPSAPAITWAVYLGCTQAYLLSREWGITKANAAYRLVRACERGHIRRVSRGVYRAGRL